MAQQKAQPVPPRRRPLWLQRRSENSASQSSREETRRKSGSACSERSSITEQADESRFKAGVAEGRRGCRGSWIERQVVLFVRTRRNRFVEPHQLFEVRAEIRANRGPPRFDGTYVRRPFSMSLKSKPSSPAEDDSPKISVDPMMAGGGADCKFGHQLFGNFGTASAEGGVHRSATASRYRSEAGEISPCTRNHVCRALTPVGRETKDPAARSRRKSDQGNQERPAKTDALFPGRSRCTDCAHRHRDDDLHS